jgi:hypothetical protein
MCRGNARSSTYLLVAVEGLTLHVDGSSSCFPPWLRTACSRRFHCILSYGRHVCFEGNLVPPHTTATTHVFSTHTYSPI